MKLVLILVMIINLYSHDLKNKIEKLIEPPQSKTIVYVKYNPFKTLQKGMKKVFNKKIYDKTFYVMSILNNRVFINSHWYNVGDKVNGYKIIQIKNNSILAKKRNKIIKYKLKRQNKILKIEDK